MKLYREDILKILKKYNFDSKEYIVLSGAALVLQNVKKYTSDIDIAVSNKLYQEILNKYNCKFDKKIDNYNIWFLDNIINFSNRYYAEIESNEIYGYRIQTIYSILQLKKKLNRLKDKQDIKYIKDFYNNK